MLSGNQGFQFHLLLAGEELDRRTMDFSNELLVGFTLYVFGKGGLQTRISG